MKNFLIILVIAVAGWFVVQKFMPQLLKPSSTIINAGNSLKNDEDRAKAAAVTANRAIIQSAILQYRGMQGSNPATLQDLVDKKYLGSIPEGDWKYNPETGELGE